jgi:hypothetical protein
MTKDEYEYKIRSLQCENDELREKLKAVQNRLDSAEYRIRTDLEPRIAGERRAYDLNLSDW